MVENCKKVLDQENEYGALLTDLFQAFDCLQHDLIVPKHHAHGFLIESLKLIFLCDMFLFFNDIGFANYADDNIYCVGKILEEVKSQLEKSSKSVFE